MLLILVNKLLILVILLQLDTFNSIHNQDQEHIIPKNKNVKTKSSENKNIFSFSAAQRQPLIAKQNSDLGPGSFEAAKLKSTCVKIGTSVRPPLALPSSAPLPGKYEYQSKIIETQGIKIKGSSYDPITKEIHSRPGPGTHDPVMKSTAPQFLIPKSQRYDFTKQKQGIPGPIYEIHEKPSTPAFKFGTSKREEIKKFDSPGPGAYS